MKRLWRRIFDHGQRCSVTDLIHDYMDGVYPFNVPIHFYTYTCRFCGTEFII